MRRLTLGLYLSVLILTGCGNSQTDQSLNDFKKMNIQTPDPSTQGPYEQAVGIYYEGHLMNASDLGFSGPGYIKLFNQRSTMWGTFDIITLIRRAADKLMTSFPNEEPLQIGDICSKTGGPLFRHLSHQNGLDADIRLLAKNHHVQSPSTPVGFDESYVVNGKISPNFDYARNWLLIKTLVGTGRINRIFLDRVIKRALCKYAKSINEAEPYKEALRRIEHFDGHTDHIHIRLTCPNNSPQCQSQGEPPDDGNCPLGFLGYIT